MRFAHCGNLKKLIKWTFLSVFVFVTMVVPNIGKAAPEATVDETPSISYNIEYTDTEYKISFDIVTMTSLEEVIPGQVLGSNEDFAQAYTEEWNTGETEPTIGDSSPTKKIPLNFIQDDKDNQILTFGDIQKASASQLSYKRLHGEVSIPITKTKKQKFQIVYFGKKQVQSSGWFKKTIFKSDLLEINKKNVGFPAKAQNSIVLYPARFGKVAAKKVSSNNGQSIYNFNAESEIITNALTGTNDFPGIKIELDTGSGFKEVQNIQKNISNEVLFADEYFLTKKEVKSKSLIASGSVTVPDGSTFKIRATLTSNSSNSGLKALTNAVQKESREYTGGEVGDDISTNYHEANGTGSGPGKEVFEASFYPLTLDSSNISAALDTEKNKIIGSLTFSISILAKPWKDDGQVKNIADGDDTYGSWDIMFDDSSGKDINGNTINADKVDITTAGLTASSKNADNSLKDLRPGKVPADFNGFILDISKPGADAFTTDKTTSIGLDELILSPGTDQTKSPVIDAMSLKVSADWTFGDQIEPNTDYVLRIRAVLDKLGGEYISPTASYHAGTLDEIKQQARVEQGVTTKELPDSGSILPECGIANTWFTSGTIGGCIVQIFYYVFYVPTSWAFAFAGIIMDYILSYTMTPGAYTADYVFGGWKLIRDLCNLFFIFILIYLAFKIMLGIGHGTKQLVVNTILVALLINFSYTIAVMAVDISNIVGRQLMHNAITRKDENSTEPISISATLVSSFDPQKIILNLQQKSPDETGPNGVNNGNSGYTTKASSEIGIGTWIVLILVSSLLNFFGFLMFLKIALQFMYRTLGIILAIILSPLAMFSLTLDEKQRSSLQYAGWDAWLNGLLQDCFKAPVFIFFMIIIILSVPYLKIAGNSTDGTYIGWWLGILIPFMMIMAFLKIAESVTTSMSSGLAKMAGDGLVKGMQAVGGFALGATAGGAAFLGRRFIGRNASQYLEGEKGKELKDKAAAGDEAAQKKLMRLSKRADASYDFRQNKAASFLSKETGVNLNSGLGALNTISGGRMNLGTELTAGGYRAEVERKKKKWDEVKEQLGFDQDKHDKLKEAKSDKEDELVDAKNKLLMQQRNISVAEEEKKNMKRGENETEDAFKARKEAKGQEILERKRERTLQQEKTNALQTGGEYTVIGDDGKPVTDADGKEVKKAEIGLAGIDKAIERVIEDRTKKYEKSIREKSGFKFHRDTYETKEIEGVAKDKAKKDSGWNNSPKTKEEKETNQALIDSHKKDTDVISESNKRLRDKFGDLAEDMKDVTVKLAEHGHGKIASAFKMAMKDGFNWQKIKGELKDTSGGVALGGISAAATKASAVASMGAWAAVGIAGSVAGIARRMVSYDSKAYAHYGVEHHPKQAPPHTNVQDKYQAPSGGGGGSKPSGGGGGHGGGGHH